MMKSKLLSAFTFLILGLVTISCEEESGYGTFYVGHINKTNTSKHYLVYLDGEFEGGFVSRANYSGIPNCSNLDPSQENTTIMTYVTSGTRKYEIKDSGTDQIVASGTIKISAGKCSSLQLY